METQKKEEEQITVPASLGKRIFAYLIDVILCFVLGFLLNRFVTGTYLYDAIGGKQAQNNAYRYAADTGLVAYTVNDDGSYSNITLFGYSADGLANSSARVFSNPTNDGRPGYEAYFDAVWHYYTVFLPTDERATPFTNADGTKYTVDDYKTYFDTKVLLLPEAKNTDPTNLATLASSDASQPYFRYALTEDGTAVDFAAKPVLTDTYVAKLASSDETEKTTAITSLRDYFLRVENNTSYAGVYYSAVLFMEGQNDSNQTYFIENYRSMNMLSWECSLVAYLPFNVIFLLLIPLCHPKGKTIGKLIFRFSLTQDDGVLLPWWKRLLRQLFVTVEFSLLLFPNSNISFIIYALFAMIDFAVLAFGKRGFALHDLPFRSLVVTKDSPMFKNYEEREEYMAKIRAKEQAEEAENEAAAGPEILDLSTINKNREEAANMTSFDEFEKQKDEEAARLAAEQASNDAPVSLHKDDEEEPVSNEEPKNPPKTGGIKE